MNDKYQVPFFPSFLPWMARTLIYINTSTFVRSMFLILFKGVIFVYFLTPLDDTIIFVIFNVHGQKAETFERQEMAKLRSENKSIKTLSPHSHSSTPRRIIFLSSGAHFEPWEPNEFIAN